MPQKLNSTIAVIGIDIGKSSFHVAAHDKRGTIVHEIVYDGIAGRAGNVSRAVPL